MQVPHRYGGVTTTRGEDTVATLPSKFKTYEAIKPINIKVSTKILKDKIRWELRGRLERKGEPRSEEMEFKRQEEKEVFRPIKKRWSF